MKHLFKMNLLLLMLCLAAGGFAQEISHIRKAYSQIKECIDSDQLDQRLNRSEVKFFHYAEGSGPQTFYDSFYASEHSDFVEESHSYRLQLHFVTTTYNVAARFFLGGVSI